VKKASRFECDLGRFKVRTSNEDVHILRVSDSGLVHAANPVGDFVNNHPTVKMLALSFLLLVGIALIADGFHFHIPRGYLYFAIFFSGLVEALNLWAARSRKRQRHLTASGVIVDDGPDLTPKA
jgi:hypothetical protein